MDELEGRWSGMCGDNTESGRGEGMGRRCCRLRKQTGVDDDDDDDDEERRNMFPPQFGRGRAASSRLALLTRVTADGETV